MTNFTYKEECHYAGPCKVKSPIYICPRCSKWVVVQQSPSMCPGCGVDLTLGHSDHGMPILRVGYYRPKDGP